MLSKLSFKLRACHREHHILNVLHYPYIVIHTLLYRCAANFDFFIAVCDVQCGDSCVTLIVLKICFITVVCTVMKISPI